jgi:hypothetical protein
MDKLCRQIEDKLCKTLSFLTQLSFTIESIADEIDNKHLKNALRAVAIESNQYAIELNTQLRRIAIIPVYPSFNDLEKELALTTTLNAPNGRGIEVLSICESCETFFVALYNDLLNNFLPGPDLKQMINYQLMGIRSAFMRIRFFNAIRFQQ